MTSALQGKTFEAAFWYNALNIEDRKKAHESLEEAFLRGAAYNMVRLGPISTEDVPWDDPRLPEPPKNMKGPLRCLIGTAKVVGLLEEDKKSNFTAELTPKDLRACREATRQAFLRAGGFTLSDEECDMFINEHGPSVAVDEILG